MARVWVLVTGGAGYIGSHVVLSLVKAGYSVGVIDNLCNSTWDAVHRIQMEFPAAEVLCETGDIRDALFLDAVFGKQTYCCVIHCAALKYPVESCAMPLDYYDTNVIGTLHLLKCMTRHGVRNMIFSSSCTVYGDPEYVPIDETHPLCPTNPYGRTKRIVEDMLHDLCTAHPSWRAVMLRYFNPAGADPNGIVGEDVTKSYTAMAMVQKAAVYDTPFRIYGDDYPTRDGTCERDFIHVTDLAEGHVAAVKYLARETGDRCVALNMGTGRGTTVRELLGAFERAVHMPVTVEYTAPRAGDVASAWADPSAAETLLEWKASRSVEDMCATQWTCSTMFR